MLIWIVLNAYVYAALSSRSYQRVECQFSNFSLARNCRPAFRPHTSRTSTNLLSLWTVAISARNISNRNGNEHFCAYVNEKHTSNIVFRFGIFFMCRKLQSALLSVTAVYQHVAWAIFRERFCNDMRTISLAVCYVLSELSAAFSVHLALPFQWDFYQNCLRSLSVLPFHLKTV